MYTRIHTNIMTRMSFWRSPNMAVYFHPKPKHTVTLYETHILSKIKMPFDGTFVKTK